MPRKNAMPERSRKNFPIRAELFHDFLTLPPFLKQPQVHGAESPELDKRENHRGKQEDDIRQHEAGGYPVQDFCDVTHFLIDSFLFL